MTERSREGWGRGSDLPIKREINVSAGMSADKKKMFPACRYTDILLSVTDLHEMRGTYRWDITLSPRPPLIPSTAFKISLAIDSG